MREPANERTSNAITVPSASTRASKKKSLINVPGSIEVTNENAADLGHIGDGSVQLICIDPPYYANVMYAELADFFYLWEKRTLGLIYPDLFSEELTDKKNEAAARISSACTKPPGRSP